MQELFLLSHAALQVTMTNQLTFVSISTSQHLNLSVRKMLKYRTKNTIMLTQAESRTSNLTDLITGDSEAKITDFLRGSLLADFYVQNRNKKIE